MYLVIEIQRHTHEQRQYKHTRDRALNKPCLMANLNRNQRVRDADNISVIHYVVSFQNPFMSKILSAEKLQYKKARKGIIVVHKFKQMHSWFARISIFRKYSQWV